MTVGEQPEQHQLEDVALADDGPLDLVEDRLGRRCDVAGVRLRSSSQQSLQVGEHGLQLVPADARGRTDRQVVAGRGAPAPRSPGSAARAPRPGRRRDRRVGAAGRLLPPLVEAVAGASASPLRATRRQPSAGPVRDRPSTGAGGRRPSRASKATPRAASAATRAAPTRRPGRRLRPARRSRAVVPQVVGNLLERGHCGAPHRLVHRRVGAEARALEQGGELCGGVAGDAEPLGDAAEVLARGFSLGRRWSPASARADSMRA